MAVEHLGIVTDECIEKQDTDPHIRVNVGDGDRQLYSVLQGEKDRV